MSIHYEDLNAADTRVHLCPPGTWIGETQAPSWVITLTSDSTVSIFGSPMELIELATSFVEAAAEALARSHEAPATALAQPSQLGKDDAVVLHHGEGPSDRVGPSIAGGSADGPTL